MQKKPEYLSDWWAIISTYEKIMWLIAAAASLIFLFQMFLFFNTILRKEQNPETESEGGSFLETLFSPRLIFVFLTFMSWTALHFFGKGLGAFRATIAGIAIGGIIAAGFAYVFYFYDRK